MTVSATAGALLGLLADRPMTGWELVEEAGSRVGNFWTIQRSQAYRELAALEREGLCESTQEQVRGRRRYRITDAGRDAYLEWVASTPRDENVRVPFLLTVAFAADIPPGRFAELIEDQRRRHAEKLERYESLRKQLAADDSPRAGGRRATLELGIGYERATLAWLDELPSHLGIDLPDSATET
ncbi:DNA-binding PadR family transcriptional regulator [Prauserella isguenensis]|uniref:DNA-binding PadR family transcriptional regulator n=1 Tax=Prauserella isguenensis TaxID=1470180 RepID=A0A839S4M9_9PSEU|nr:DNA-binding PadR family transcriptional regulator [Prauserella isguenensis]